MLDTENPYQSPSHASPEANASVRSYWQQFAVGTNTAFCFAVTPAVVMVLLFYSLAFHMFLSLGAWPTSIGEKGFPPSLVTHAKFAQVFFLILLLSGFAWPFLFLVCAAVTRLRYLLKYLAAFAISCVVCAIAMSLAPSQFLYWWWD